jgi:hypothetical protein
MTANSCRVRPGQRLVRGAKLGMIMFGSRTELDLAAEPRRLVLVHPGDVVRGGRPVLARDPC